MPRENSKCKKWEKDRRDRLKENFNDLSKVLPCYDPSITMSKADILQKATLHIQELQDKVKKLVSPAVEDTQTAKDDIVKKLQERIKRVINRNEQLSNLLREARITIPSSYAPIKKFKHPTPWSHRITPEQAKIFQKKEAEKENNSDAKKEVVIKTKVKSLKSTSKTRKASKSEISRNKRKSTLREKMQLANNSKCVIVLSQSNSTPPCYIITSAPSSSAVVKATSSTVISSSGLITTPMVSATLKPILTTNKPQISNLGPGTLILANGTILPVVQPAQAVLSNSTILSSIPQKPTVIVLPNSTKTNIVSKSNSIIKPLVRIRPKYCLTRTTQVNKVPIPASRYATTFINLRESKEKPDKTKPKKRKVVENSLKTESKKSKLVEETKDKQEEPVKLPEDKQPEETINKKVPEIEEPKEPQDAPKEKIVEQQEKKAQQEEDLNLAHSELSNDIFASLQVPSGCQNPESTSPTAAFLLAFPLVSSLNGVKVAEVIDEENSESQRGTPNLLQIGTMDSTKTTQSQTDSFLNLDNFSLFSGTNYYNNYCKESGPDKAVTREEPKPAKNTEDLNNKKQDKVEDSNNIFHEKNIFDAIPTKLDCKIQIETVKSTNIFEMASSKSDCYANQKSHNLLSCVGEPQSYPNLKLGADLNESLRIYPESSILDNNLPQVDKNLLSSLDSVVKSYEYKHVNLTSLDIKNYEHPKHVASSNNNTNKIEGVNNNKLETITNLNQINFDGMMQGGYTLEKNNTNLNKAPAKQANNKLYSQCNFTDSSKVTACSYAIVTKTYTTPLYTNSNNYSYNYTETNFNQNYYKNMPKTESRPYYPINYDNYDYRSKTESSCSTYYNNTQTYSKNSIQKTKSSSQTKQPINWMTTPDSRVQATSDYLLPPFTKENDFSTYVPPIYPSNSFTSTSQNYFNSCAPSNIYSNSETTLQSDGNKALNLPIMPVQTRTEDEDNPFSWPSTKIPQFLDPPTSFMSSTLPTLVGDLALGNTILPEQKSTKKRTKSSVYDHSSFLSVSQLVEGKSEVPAKTVSRRNSAQRSKTTPQKVKRPSKVAEAPKQAPTNSYSAEALISAESPVKRNHPNTKQQAVPPVPPFLTDNIIPYFPPVELPQDNYVQQNQNYQPNTFSHNFPTSYNNTYTSNTFIPPVSTITTTYLPGNNFIPEDFVPENLFKDKTFGKPPKTSCSNPKKGTGKKKTSDNMSFEFPFLAMPGSINSPILPDDFHNHQFLAPSAPFPCKNSTGSLLPPPVPPVPGVRGGLQHPEVSPAAGTSLTNFNLSAIFPEMNKNQLGDSYQPEVRLKDQTSGGRSYVPATSIQVPFSSNSNNKPTLNFPTYNNVQ